MIDSDVESIDYTLPQKAIASRTRLIVGIDFGTTFSGASFTLLHPKDKPENAQISVVRDWKGELPGSTTSNKIPTVIAYDKDGAMHWGFDIPNKLTNDTIRWLKLLLEPEILSKRAWIDGVDPSATKAKLRRLRKNAIQAASDYVRLLWEHVKAQIINEYSKATYDFAEKSIVFTVPAVWSETAKHNTFLVAVGAGLGVEDLQLQTISEPEAAAVAVLKERGPVLKEDDCYVVVDAGGGTVDLTTYVLRSTDPIQLEELIAGDGDVCGTVFLEINFVRLLRTYLSAEVLDNLPKENLDRIINDFETGVRKYFDGGDNTNYTVSMAGVPDSSCQKIKAGLLRLTAADLKPVFMPIIEKIERLVRKQIKQLQVMKRTPKAILLVGGFGTNRFLATRLKQTYEVNRKDSPDLIEVLQPNIGWESIANGAVRCEAMGIGNIMSFRIARFNLGLEYSSGFDPKQDEPWQRYVCEFDGLVKAKGQMKWYLKKVSHLRGGKPALSVQTLIFTKGDRIKPGQEIDFALNFKFYDTDCTGATDFSIKAKLYQSSEAKIAGRKTKRKYSAACFLGTRQNQKVFANQILENAGTRHFVTLEFPWDARAHPLTAYKQRTSQKGKPYRKAPIVIHMRQGPANMEFEYSVDGEKRGAARSINFQDLEIAPQISEEASDDETLLG